jgi:asparagine synthase (glutamine-hydrolysing)
VSALAGVLFRTRPQDDATVARMLAAAPHRGPCTRSVALGRVALGVAHGDIADASLASNGTMAAACCGSIDNRDELRSRLARAGLPVAGASDADVLLAAFRHFGPRTPAELRGPFVGAITDGERLWCFRDHLGLRSLFHRDRADALYVASEAKQVAAGAGIAVRADRDVVERVFWGEDHNLASAVRGIQRLDTATLLTATPASSSHERYWDPSHLLESARPSQSDLQEQFDALMTQAVRRSLAGRDVIMLSGGIDSPTLAAYAAPLHEELFGSPLPALSIVSPDQPSVDESEYIKVVVDRFGFPWQTFEQRVLTGGGLDRWAELCDGPVPTVTLNEMEECYTTVHQRGFRNVLTGEMAEFVMDRREGLLVHLLVRGRRQALAQQIRTHRADKRGWSSIALELASVLAPRWLTARRRRRDWPTPAWVDRARATSGPVRHASAPRHRWRSRQLAALRGSNPTVEAGEVCEMLCGVRVRRPWVDIDLWEFFLALPAEVKYAGPLRKSIVRRLARGRVPDVILDRRDKTVFDASIRARLNYAELVKWLDRPQVRLPGVDYDLLRRRLAARELDLLEYRWARDLASAHAFLQRFGD